MKIYCYQANPDHIEHPFDTNVVVLSRIRPLTPGSEEFDEPWALSEWNLTRIKRNTLVICDYEPNYLESTFHKKVLLSWISWFKQWCVTKFGERHVVRLLTYPTIDYDIIKRCNGLHPDLKKWYPNHNPVWIEGLRKQYADNPVVLDSIKAMDNPGLTQVGTQHHQWKNLYERGLYLGAAWNKPVIVSFSNQAGYRGGFFGDLPEDEIEAGLVLIRDAQHLYVRVSGILLFGSNKLTPQYVSLVQRVFGV